MTPEYFTTTIERMIERQLYRVFTVELHGGRRFEVDHPRAIIVREGNAVFLAPGGIPIWFDHESVNQIIGAGAGIELDDRGSGSPTQT